MPPHLSRRSFLGGASVAALLKAKRIHAKDGIPRGQFIQVASAAGSVTGQEYPFINFMKNWAYTQPTGGSYAFVSTLNDDGYPQSALQADYGGVVLIPPSLTGPGTTWVFKWKGKAGDSSNNQGLAFTTIGGSVSVGRGFVVGSTATSLNFVGRNGRIVFTFHQSSTVGQAFKMNAGMVVNGTLSDIVLCPLELEAAHDAGELFNPQYLASMRALNPRGLRTTNWTAVNSAAGSNLTQLAGQMPTTALSYWSRFVPGFWCGNATGTNAYTVARGAGITAIVDGTTIQCVIVNANSISGVTMAVNGLMDPFGTIDIPILDIGGGALAGNAIQANLPWTLIYDAGLRAWLGVYGGRGNRDGIQTGVPLSVQIALCNELNIDLYLNLPPHATDALITSWATTIKDTLNPRLTCWYEISDEIWNFGYSSTSWFRQSGAKRGWAYTSNSQGMFSFYALKFRQWSELIKMAYGSQTNFKRLLNFQAFGDGNINNYLLNGSALGSMALTLTGISASATTPTVTASSIVKYVDGQQVVLAVSGTGAIGALNGMTVYVSSPSGNRFLLSSTPYPKFTPISTAGGTFSSGSSQTLYGAAGGIDYTAFPNRPVDWCDALSYATYYYGAQLRWIEGNTGGDNGYLTMERSIAINAATRANTCAIQTSRAHGYSTGQRVQFNDFTGAWVSLNGQSAFVTAVDATHFTVPVDTSGFASAYSSNGGDVSRYADIMSDFVAAGRNYASGDPTLMNKAIAWMDSDIRAGPLLNGNVASETLSSLNSTANGGHGIYPLWESVAKSYDAARESAGMPKLQVVCYEGGMQGLIPQIPTLTQLGRTASAICTLNIGSTPAVTQTAHGYRNGFRIRFASSGSLPSGGQINPNVDYFVMNAATDSYDVSSSYYNQVAITLTGRQSGTVTVTADTNGLDNLLNGYKTSATFQATVKFQFDQFFEQAHSYLAAWYELAVPDNWSLYPFDIYGTPFTSYDALKVYQFP